MRAAIGIISLLLALVAVGLLAKKQLTATRVVVPALQPATGESGTHDAAPSTVRAQSQQVQQQYKQAVEGLMQARPMPDDEK